jgi:hypothetical protein
LTEDIPVSWGEVAIEIGLRVRGTHLAQVPLVVNEVSAKSHDLMPGTFNDPYTGFKPTTLGDQLIGAVLVEQTYGGGIINTHRDASCAVRPSVTVERFRRGTLGHQKHPNTHLGPLLHESLYTPGNLWGDPFMGFAGEYIVFTLGTRKSPRVFLHHYENQWLVNREALKFVEVVEKEIGNTMIHLVGHEVQLGGGFVEVQRSQVAPVAMGRAVEWMQQKT